MKIAILGGGHGCYAAAVEMTEKGHDVSWWRRDDASHDAVRRAGGVTVKDFRGERAVPIATLTADLAAAVGDAALVLIPLPATTHEDLAPRLAPLLVDGQVVYLPPGTFGTAMFARALHDVRPDASVSFAETGTLPYLARKHSDTHVVVSGYATRLPTGVLPSKNTEHALAVLREAYPSVERDRDALGGALMNAGPIIHPPLILMNAGPLEHFPAWDIHNEGTQPSIRRVTDALDAERMGLRERLGYPAPHFPLSDHYATEGDEWMYGRNAHERLTDSGDWREDIDLTAHRYMLEDTRLGLSLLVSVANWAGYDVPLCKGLLAMGAAVAERNFVAEGRTLESLGLSELSNDEMTAFLERGWSALS